MGASKSGGRPRWLCARLAREAPTFARSAPPREAVAAAPLERCLKANTLHCYAGGVKSHTQGCNTCCAVLQLFLPTQTSTGTSPWCRSAAAASLAGRPPHDIARMRHRYQATVAGRHALAVACSTTGEALAGSPFDIDVGPGPAAAAACRASLAVLDGGEAMPLEPGANPVPTLLAGAEVAVSMAAADAYGNAAAAPGEGSGRGFAVEALGPRQAPLPFARRPGGAGAFTALLTAAGSYVVHARQGDVALAGWPRVLHVAPGASDAARCL